MITAGTLPRIVVIGGGSGSSTVLRGLKTQRADLTAIVTMFDSGGSSGLLRKEFGYPPMGDLRQCLLALSEDSRAMEMLRTAFSFRFREDSSLNGHNLGNLLLAALTTLHNDVEGAIEEMSSILRIRGRVVPVALEPSDLCAELEDGTVLREESTIDLRGMQIPRIGRVFLDPPVKANPRAIKCIREADAVVLGPGDLYTSIIPNLLAQGVAEALRETDATKICVVNLMTKPGETDGFKASDFAREITHYMCGATLDWVLINTRLVPRRVLGKYDMEGSVPVEADVDDVLTYASHALATPLSQTHSKVRHDPERLAEAIMSVIDLARVPAPHLNGHVPSDAANQLLGSV